VFAGEGAIRRKRWGPRLALGVEVKALRRMYELQANWCFAAKSHTARYIYVLMTQLAFSAACLGFHDIGLPLATDEPRRSSLQAGERG